MDTALDQTHLRLQPAGQLLYVCFTLFILLQCKLCLLFVDILMAAAATAIEIGHLISKGILELGKNNNKKKSQQRKGKHFDSPPGYVEWRTG